MTKVSRRFIDKQTQAYLFQTFIRAASKLSSPILTKSFFEDLLLTPTEQIMLSKRLCVAYMLQKHYPHRSIADTLKLSTTTINRVNNILKTHNQGIKPVLNMMLGDEKVRDFFNQLDTLIGKLMLPPKGNWSNHYKDLAANERSKTKLF